MAIKDGFLFELKNEAAKTRRMLERVPIEQYAYKPHEKSATLGFITTHVVNLFRWAVITMKQEALDIGPNSGFQRPKAAENTAELLAMLDKNVEEAREALSTASDEHMNQPWTLHAGEHQIFTLPRHVVLRDAVFNHIIHHRGQLSVYLRLLNVAVPGMYGPSADEQPLSAAK